MRWQAGLGTGPSVRPMCPQQGAGDPHGGIRTDGLGVGGGEYLGSAPRLSVPEEWAELRRDDQVTPKVTLASRATGYLL